MLHAPRDPLLISKLPKAPPKTDFMSPNQNCPQRTISTKLLRMSWSAVLLICLSSQPSPDIHSCLLRLSKSTLENITHGRDGGDFKKPITLQIIHFGSRQPLQAGYIQWCHWIKWKLYACYAGEISRTLRMVLCTLKWKKLIWHWWLHTR